jgi:hypothetical protein
MSLHREAPAEPLSRGLAIYGMRQAASGVQLGFGRVRRFFLRLARD